jgi:hypothetical protein
MPLLPRVTRDQLPDDLRPLWDECERLAPSFRDLWATMASSPTIFRHVWGQLLELKRSSPVAARQYEIGILLVWAGIHARTADVHPRAVHALRRRLHARLAERFSARQIEELTWRFAQCVAFNWHNEFLELDAPADGE